MKVALYIIRRLYIFLSLVLSVGLSNEVLAQGTAFSYQGELQVSGAPANGGGGGSSKTKRMPNTLPACHQP